MATVPDLHSPAAEKGGALMIYQALGRWRARSHAARVEALVTSIVPELDQLGERELGTELHVLLARWRAGQHRTEAQINPQTRKDATHAD